LKVLATKQEAGRTTVTKIDQVVGFLVELRDSIEDLLDELVPPPVEEACEEAISAAPPTRGGANQKGGVEASGVTTTRVPPRRGSP